jgi:hypothetical protein
MVINLDCRVAALLAMTEPVDCCVANAPRNDEKEDDSFQLLKYSINELRNLYSNNDATKFCHV